LTAQNEVLIAVAMDDLSMASRGRCNITRLILMVTEHRTFSVFQPIDRAVVRALIADQIPLSQRFFGQTAISRSTAILIATSVPI